jgi:hypothetical protein
LEGRGPRGCLMNMVDDATSATQARLGKEETIWAAAGVLRAPADILLPDTRWRLRMARMAFKTRTNLSDAGKYGLAALR